jgi:hypothetical protein
MMTYSDWLAVIALIISSGGFAINLRNWFMSGPLLHLSIMADALSIPDDGKGPRIALIVINRGTTATMLTHMVFYGYSSWWAKWRKREVLTGLVNCPTIPFVLDVNKTWIGYMFHDAKTNQYRAKGQLYVGVISAHSNKNYLIKVPPKSVKDVPTKEVAKGTSA